jgi:hypothetical protein
MHLLDYFLINVMLLRLLGIIKNVSHRGHLLYQMRLWVVDDILEYNKK